jgi:signal transduction histidine kinase
VDEDPKRVAELETLVRSDQARSLYSRGLVAVLTNLVNAAIIVIGLWNTVEHPRLLGWLVCMFLVVLPRVVLWRRHRGAAEDAPYAWRKWRGRWIAGAAITGCVWGAAALFLFPEHSVAGQYLVLFVIGGMVAGASASTAGSLAAFLAFTLPALAPAIVRLLADMSRIHGTMALLMIVFGSAMTLIAVAGGRALTQSIRLRFKNSLLVGELRSTHDEVVALNRNLEARVAARTEQLQEALRERESFMKVISHELRTPLATMSLNQAMLSRDVREHVPGSERLHRRLELLARQAQRLNQLVDDLTDVSRLSAEQMRYHMEPVRLSTIVAEALEQLEPQLARVADFSVEVKAEVLGNWDSLRIQQVIINLLTNALKHGAPPFTVTAGRHGLEARIVVSDSGKGIPPEHARRIFGAFEQLDPNGKSGLGLGLYIAERIVHAHGGTIRVESEPGRGSSFIVDLPIAAH